MSKELPDPNEPLPDPNAKTTTELNITENTLDLKIADTPSTLTFICDTVFVGTENLCLGFKEEGVPWDCEKIHTLIFKIKDKIYTYKKEPGDAKT